MTFLLCNISCKIDIMQLGIIMAESNLKIYYYTNMKELLAQ